VRARKPVPRKVTPRKVTSPRVPRIRVASGPPRPQYLLNEENDRMMMIITALAAEVSVLRERLDTHEALGGKRRFPSAKSVEAFKVDAARREAREHARQAMLLRVFRILFEDLDGARAQRPAVSESLLSEETAD